MKVSEAFRDRGIITMLYGQSGSGKTSACRNLPANDTLWIVTEMQQTASVLSAWGWQDWTAVEIHDRKQFESAVEETKQKWIVVDTLSGYYDLLRDLVANLDGRPISQQGFKLYQETHEQFLSSWRKLEAKVGEGHNAVVLCHLNYTESALGQSKQQLRSPDLPGKMPEKICKRIPVTGRCESIVLNGQPRYNVRFQPLQDGDYGTDRFSVLENKEPNDIVELYKKLENKMAAVDSGSTSFPSSPTTAASLEQKIDNLRKQTKLNGQKWGRFLNKTVGKKDLQKLNSEETDTVVAALEKLQKEREEPWT